MPTDRLFVLCAVVLVACLVLGGGTRAGFLSDAAIQFLAIPLLLMALRRIAGHPSAKPARPALLLCLAIVLVPALQLIPLPPGVWTALPNRAVEAETFRLLAQDLPWMPASLSPRATWLAMLSLLPPVAVFLGTLLLNYGERRALSIVVIIFGVLSAFVGLAQVAEGPSSSLRFYEITNASEAVGFFANRNHLAALLYAITVLAAAWAVEAASPPAPGRTRLDSRWLVPVIASFTVLVILVAAQTMARSRAGLGLTIVALLGAAVVAWRDPRNASGLTPAKLLLAATALAMMFATQFALYRVMERFADDSVKEGRLTIARLTAEAAQHNMPVGAGMGTFVPVYGMQERAADAMLDVYVNHAHNDFLELWLEAGVAGLGVVALCLLWLVGRSWRLWRRDAPGAEIDVSIARAGTIIVALIVAHSAVDYPLRTGAIMAIIAFACGLIAPSLGVETSARKSGDRPQAAKAAAKRRPSSQRPTANEPISQHQPERWGNDVEWPKEWR